MFQSLIMERYHKSARTAKKSLKLIENTLQGDEKVIAAGDALVKSPGAWVVTNKRIIFASKKLFSSDLIEIPREKINSVDSAFGPLLNKVEIVASNRKLTLKHLKPSPARALINALNT